MSHALFGYRVQQFVPDDISPLLGEMFASLPRSDQRHWAEVYVQGLLTVSGRKTVKRISDQVAGGGAEQCLQQFVNQSTWSSAAIRRDVALLLGRPLDPSYWVLADVVIPKNGRHSVGVDRQFAYPEGRTLNCQLGLALFQSGSDWNCPVNWRLQLPPNWEDDTERRAKAHVPATEGCKPRWRLMLDTLDETAAEWAIPPRPVIGDLTAESDTEPLLRGLDDRHLPYAVKVSASRPAGAASDGRHAATFGQVLADAIRHRTVVDRWQFSGHDPTLTRVVAARLSAAGRPGHVRHLVAEWSPANNVPRTAWVTSIPPHDLSQFLEGLLHHRRVLDGMDALYEDLGLRHFEGRSFSGWHHHATLVSVAAGCRILTEIARRPVPVPVRGRVLSLGGHHRLARHSAPRLPSRA
jgi:hypothetical protein